MFTTTTSSRIQLIRWRSVLTPAHKQTPPPLLKLYLPLLPFLARPFILGLARIAPPFPGGRFRHAKARKVEPAAVGTVVVLQGAGESIVSGDNKWATVKK